MINQKYFASCSVSRWFYYIGEVLSQTLSQFYTFRNSVILVSMLLTCVFRSCWNCLRRCATWAISTTSENINPYFYSPPCDYLYKAKDIEWKIYFCKSVLSSETFICFLFHQERERNVIYCVFARAARSLLSHSTQAHVQHAHFFLIRLCVRYQHFNRKIFECSYDVPITSSDARSLSYRRVDGTRLLNKVTSTMRLHRFIDFMDNVVLATMSCEHASPWMAFILIGSSSSRPRAPLIFDAAISSRVNNASSKFRDSFAGFVPEASERPSNLFSPQNHTRDRGLFLFPNQKPCE